MGITYSKSGDKWQPEATVKVVNPLLLGAASVMPLVIITGLLIAPSLPKAATQVPKVQLPSIQMPEIDLSAFAPVPVEHTQRSAWLGKVKVGAFSGEAAHLAGITHVSTYGLADAKQYAKYRESVHSTYGADLEDMNYFSLKQENFKDRVEKLERWILMAGEYGDVTIALEPLGEEKYDIFHDSTAMEFLSRAFQRAEKHDITIWIRFASESNLRGSEYSATQPSVADDFYEAAADFKSQMPGNVKLVFSPLINTFYVGKKYQKSLARRMFYGPNESNVLWDRIGGTIYRTTHPLLPMYEDYYSFMHELDPEAPFQICELGCAYPQREEVLAFLKLCGDGNWSMLEKVNLFARDINSRADPYSQFGYLEPVERAEKSKLAQETGEVQPMDSYIKPLITVQ
ncbi:MAG: hypothetical protein KF824_10995 [Fimbriimonadaceae bacterium]|nr:MAG: hypothetical protein KF824_10995 [Fimbriimonadaceae bacterium]